MNDRFDLARIEPVRPWYREPWPWVLIAIPLATIIACGFTLWLAISRPDYLVLDEQQYQEVSAELKADAKPGAKEADEQH